MKGGENMDSKYKKTLLLWLCKEITKAVEYLYDEENAGLKAHLGEVLGRWASVLANVGWAITWADKEVQDKVFEVIDEAYWKHDANRLKCSLEEWLSWKVREVVDSALEDTEGERETQQTQTPTDELPF
jgi:hypothetical protein